MKLAAGYIVFDGLETLEKSIRSIRQSVDLVLVSYQKISWGNTRCSPDLLPTLQRLLDSGLVDEIMEFTDFVPSSLAKPDDVIIAKSFEANKRQSLLNRARSLNCTHYLSMDADEFYIESEFEHAKSVIVRDALDATAVKYINYVTPTLSRGISQWLVPFIYRITDSCKHSPDQMIFGGIDPTRGLMDFKNYKRSKIFSKDEILMHHMEMVRADISGKYRASSRFFNDRSIIETLEKDILRTAETGKLHFASERFGERSDNKGRSLSLCEDRFGLMSY
jgi:hypothetical protein